MKQLLSKLRSKAPAPKGAPEKDLVLDESDLGPEEELPEEAGLDPLASNPELEAVSDEILMAEMQRRGFEVAPPAMEEEMNMGAAEEMPEEEPASY